MPRTIADSPSGRGALRRFHEVSLLLSLLSNFGCYPHSPGSRLAHFEVLAPRVGELAPPTSFVTAEGSAIELASLLDGRPLVLQLGSHTCPVYRYRRHSLRPIWEKYAGRVRFVLVYTREAHPVGSPSPYLLGEEWDPWINRMAGVRLREPRSLEERIARAVRSRAELELPVELFVDDFENSTWRTFGSAASPAFVLDAGGSVVLRQVWIEPHELAAALEKLLRDTAPSRDLEQP